MHMASSSRKLVYVIVVIVGILLWIRYKSSTVEFFDLFRVSDADFQKQLKRVERRKVRSAQSAMNDSLNKKERDYQERIRLELETNKILAERQFTLMGSMLRSMKSNTIHWSPLNHPSTYGYDGSEDTTVQETPLHGSDLRHSYEVVGSKDAFQNYDKMRGFPSSLPGKKIDDL